MVSTKRRRLSDKHNENENNESQQSFNNHAQLRKKPKSVVDEFETKFDAFRERLMTLDAECSSEGGDMPLPHVLKRKFLKRFLDMMHNYKDHPHFRDKIGPRCDMHFLIALLHHYRCTLSHADILIFAILELLERHLCLDFRIASPLVFGPSSKAYYEELIRYGRALHKYLTPDQVLAYFDQKLLWESMLKLAHFDKHYSASFSKGPADVDRAIEAAAEGVGPNCYDPRFVLRLLVQLVAPGTKLSCRPIVQSNALSFALAATSFHSASLRALAYAFLQRFRTRLAELSDERFPERLLFRHMLTLLSNSLTHGCNQRITHVASQFLARLAKVILVPSEPIYAPLVSSLTQKPWLHLDSIPEWFRLFFSTSTENCLRERQWVLRLLTNGIVDSQDYGAICRVFAIESCMALWCSPMADFWAKLLLLKIFSACLDLPSAARDLFHRLDLAGWLTNAISHSRTTPMEMLQLIALFRRLVEQQAPSESKKPKLLMDAKLRLCALRIVAHLRTDQRIAIDRQEREREDHIEWIENRFRLKPEKYIDHSSASPTISSAESSVADDQ